MILSDISIKRPVFTAMVVIALMTLGLLAVRSIGVDLFPDISFPVVTVVTVYPGAGPEEVEQLVTKRIEESVSSVNGVDEVRSYSRDSVSTVVIQFKLEADVKVATTDVRDRVAAIRNLLPTDVKEPIVQRLDPTALPILNYSVSSNRPVAETRRIVEDVIKPKVEAVDGVGAVNVIGGKEREIHVFVDRSRLDSLGLSISQVAQQIGSESFDLPGGRVTTGGAELNVKTLGRFRSLDDMRSMVVASLANGSQVHLSDVARVEDGFVDARTRVRLNGVDSVTFEIQKQGGSNTVAIADHVYKVLDTLKATLPSDVKMVKAVDGSTFIRQNVSDVTEAIVYGGLMAILVIFIFMLDWRSTLISSLALPTSVVTTFLAMSWLGFTFNIMSLLGLSLAIGLLIDDAVVVRENIYRHMERGEDPITAAQRGTSEIGLAVMATTFTVVAVFVPVAFMGGVVGRMFRQFGLTVASAVLVSLFISFTLDPMLSARVVKPIQPGHHERLKHHKVFGPVVRVFDALDHYYRGVLAWALMHRYTVVAAAAVLFVASLALTPMMGKEFFGGTDRGEFRVNLEMPAGTSLDQMDQVTSQAEALIKQNPEVRDLFTTIGPSEEANKASIRVQTTKKEKRKVSQVQVQEDLRKRLAVIPALKYVVADIGFVEGPATELPITLYARGDDYRVLQRVARDGLDAIKTTRGTKDADMSYRAGKPETDLAVDRARAADLGVSVGSVAMTVRTALEGVVVAKYRDGDRDYDVRVQLPPEDRTTTATLGELTVPATGRRMGTSATVMAGGQGPGGGGPRLVKLADVSTIKNETGPATIERMNRQRQIILMANVAGRSLGEAVADVETKLGKIDKPAGFQFVFGGQTKNMRETFSNLLLALFVAVVFIYFVLASQFESFIHPFTIMAALPLAIVGALLLLFLTGMAINMPSMIGVVLLLGLVTKNSILLVDYTNELRARGKSMAEALLEAGPTRLRPILMTSAAMVLGMLPTALSRGEGSEFRAPMSTAVIGGVITSTILTLVVVPVVYTWMDQFTLKDDRKSKATHDPSKAAADASLHAVEGEAKTEVAR
ncbi:MAG TPA: efflux RND transporter permease subunit [Myxococcaceae bacterium]|nr:efflux RND transporter permease subunit [Myxococcaceae bacterium]